MGVCVWVWVYWWVGKRDRKKVAKPEDKFGNLIL